MEDIIQVSDSDSDDIRITLSNFRKRPFLQKKFVKRVKSCSDIVNENTDTNNDEEPDEEPNRATTPDEELKAQILHAEYRRKLAEVLNPDRTVTIQQTQELNSNNAETQVEEPDTDHTITQTQEINANCTIRQIQELHSDNCSRQVQEVNFNGDPRQMILNANHQIRQTQILNDIRQTQSVNFHNIRPEQVPSPEPNLREMPIPSCDQMRQAQMINEQNMAQQQEMPNCNPNLRHAQIPSPEPDVRPAPHENPLNTDSHLRSIYIAAYQSRPFSNWYPFHQRLYLRQQLEMERRRARLVNGVTWPVPELHEEIYAGEVAKEISIRELSIQAIEQILFTKRLIAANSRLFNPQDIENCDQMTCVICFTRLKGRGCIRELRCSHKFHQKCIDEWLMYQRNCPICRWALTANIVYQNAPPQYIPPENQAQVFLQPPSANISTLVFQGRITPPFEIRVQNSNTATVTHHLNPNNMQYQPRPPNEPNDEEDQMNASVNPGCSYEIPPQFHENPHLIQNNGNNCQNPAGSAPPSITSKGVQTNLNVRCLCSHQLSSIIGRDLSASLIPLCSKCA